MPSASGSGGFFSFTLGGASLISDNAVWIIMGRSPYIKPEKKYARVQVGETVEIWINSNWGTKVDDKESKNADFIEISKNTTYSEGLPIEQYTVKGEKVGTAVLVLKDDYDGYETEAVTVVVIDGEASIGTLYSIIDTTGYDDKNGNKAVELEAQTSGKRVFCENHSDYVRFVCVDQNENGHAKSITYLDVPLEAHDIYPVTIYKSSPEEPDFEADVDSGQYTSGTELTIKKPASPSEEVIEFVKSTFGESMVAWNSALDKNYEMIMKNMGFTNY